MPSEIIKSIVGIDIMQYQVFSGGQIGPAEFDKLSESYKSAGHSKDAYAGGSYLFELWSMDSNRDIESLRRRTSSKVWQEEGKWIGETPHLKYRADNHDGDPHINVDLKAKKSKILGGAHRIDIDK